LQIEVSKRGARTILTWDTRDSEEVEKARSFFDRRTKQGWLAFASEKNKLRRTLEFRPEHGKLWFIPLAEGG